MIHQNRNNINFYLCDNIEFMKTKPDKHYDLAIVDPPYGLGNRLSDGGGKLKHTPMAELYRNKEWDILPTSEYWEQLFRVSKNQIVFGANYFLEYLPSTRGFVCWDKNQAMPTLSACELVWTSFDKPAKIMKKSSTDLMRFHPTQKPVYVYRFMLEYVKAEKGSRILDTHGGSMTIAKACDIEGFALDICEIDEEYFNNGLKAYDEYKRQQTLF